MLSNTETMLPDVLRVAVLPRIGTFIVNNTPDGKAHVVGGFEKTLLNIILQKFRMNYTLTCPHDGQWGSLDSNGSWSGLVGMIQRNEADIVMGGFAVTEQRTAVLKYSYPYTIKDITFARRLPRDLPGYYSFIMPFDYVVWSVLLFVLIISPFFAQLVMGNDNIRRKIKNSCQIFRVLLEQSISISLTTYSQKIMFGTWFLSVLFISNIYKSLILAFLSVPLKEPGVENVKDLYEALKFGSHSCTTVKGAFFANKLAHSFDKYSASIGQYIIKNEFYIENTREACLEYVHSGNNVLIFSREALMVMFQDSVFISKDAFFMSEIAIGVKKNFRFSDELDRIIFDYTASGILQKDFSDYIFLQKLHQSNVSLEYKRLKKLNLQDLSGAFITLLLGITLSVITLILELAYNKFCYAQNKKQDGYVRNVSSGMIDTSEVYEGYTHSHIFEIKLE